MYVIKVLSILLVVTNALANIVENRNLEDSKLQDLEVISSTADTDEDSVVTRAKKSATTTFCVEIRPSGPYQRPFQVCEPAEPAKPEPTSAQTYSAYFAAPNYVPQDQPKAEIYKPPSQPKSNAIFSAPVKTYLPPTPAPKQYAAHSASYGSYRSKSEESGTEDHSGHLMRMSHAEEENNSDSAIVSEQQMRSASHGVSSYGSHNYGTTSYVPVVPEHAEKHRSHNGLVITCQPNLAGYAHNVPSSLHHPPALHTYSYRSSTPSESNGRYGRYQVQSHSYGNYQQPPTYKPIENAYKSGKQSATPSQQYSSVYSSQTAYAPAASAYSSQTAYAPAASAYSSQTAYTPAASAYSSPHLQAPTSYAPLPNAVHPSAPISVPQARHPAPSLQPPQSYVHFSQNYAPVPPGNAVVPNSSPYASASGYAPVSAVLPATVPSSYSQAQSYSNLPPPAPLSTSTSQGQGYVSSGAAYREAEEDHRMQTVAQQHKEKHTIKKMEEVSHQRAAASQWGSEMSQEKATKDKKDEHVESTQKGWSAKKRATEKVVDVKGESDKINTGKNHESENEVNRIDN